MRPPPTIIPHDDISASRQSGANKRRLIKRKKKPSDAECGGVPVRRLGENVESAENKVASIGVALGQIGPQLGEMAGLSKELTSTSAKAAAGERALKELEKSIRAVERGMASLEVELKSQRRDIAKVMTTVDRMAAGTQARR